MSPEPETSAGPPTPSPSPSATGAPGTAEQAGAPGPVPLDADDTRGLHFKRLLTSPVTLSVAVTLAIAAFVAATIGAGVAVGGGAAAVVLLLAVMIVFVMASSQAKEDFFSAYASSRKLNRAGTMTLPPSTPLLRKGDKRYAEHVMNGTLPGGFPGAIGLYTYEVETTDSEGDHDTDYYRFTVVLHDIPHSAHKVSEVLCQRRSGFRFMDSAEDVFRRMKRLELESITHDKRYEVFYGAHDDENWLKQLFSPSFIVWLSDNAPENFAFELSAGSLCANVKGHKNSAAELDAICEAAAVVARRLAEESVE
jgi:hypothetical protein